MKNIIIIDLDTERDTPLFITKPEDMVDEINNESSEKKVILLNCDTYTLDTGMTPDSYCDSTRRFGPFFCRI